MNLETKITIYKFTPQLFTLTHELSINDLIMTILVHSLHNSKTRGKN